MLFQNPTDPPAFGARQGAGAVGEVRIIKYMNQFQTLELYSEV